MMPFHMHLEVLFDLRNSRVGFAVWFDVPVRNWRLL